jgi:cytochrome c biogenesis protein CcmG/thiol:disulfide interchange protein DsbE
MVTVAGLVVSGACAPPDRPAGVGTSAPDVSALTLEGDTVQLSSFRGQPILLNLWATWCLPCRREAPYLQELAETLGRDGLRVVGLSLDRAGFEPEIRAFMEEFGVSYTVLRDPEMASMDRYPVAGLPATFLVDRDGTIRHAVAGPVAEGDRVFEAALREILE